MSTMKQISGQRFGRLTAISPSHKLFKQNKSGKVSSCWYWKCVCDCGNETTSLITRLTNGSNKSCGCLLNDWNIVQKSKVNHDKQVMRQYLKSCKKRDLNFDLPFEIFCKLIHTPCHYCKLLPETRNGIDRKNNKIGYTVSNSLPCCKQCNMAKGGMAYDSFISYINRFKSNGEATN